MPSSKWSLLSCAGRKFANMHFSKISQDKSIWARFQKNRISFNSAYTGVTWDAAEGKLDTRLQVRIHR